VFIIFSVLLAGKLPFLELIFREVKARKMSVSVEWKTDAFRSSLVRKLEEAIRESGSQNQKSAVEEEKQVEKTSLWHCYGFRWARIGNFYPDP
jgi:hypothetical protein